MANLDDLDDSCWRGLLTRSDNLSLSTKKVIVRVGTGAGMLACLALLPLLAGCDPLSRVLRC